MSLLKEFIREPGHEEIPFKQFKVCYLLIYKIAVIVKSVLYRIGWALETGAHVQTMDRLSFPSTRKEIDSLLRTLLHKS